MFFKAKGGKVVAPCAMDDEDPNINKKVSNMTQEIFSFIQIGT